eukprot:4126249-Ditylum_brightwellii.AAC.1
MDVVHDDDDFQVESCFEYLNQQSQLGDADDGFMIWRGLALAIAVLTARPNYSLHLHHHHGNYNGDANCVYISFGNNVHLCCFY